MLPGTTFAQPGQPSHPPLKRTTHFNGFTDNIDHISIPRNVTQENSLDLSSGRRPTSKSVEFSWVTFREGRYSHTPNYCEMSYLPTGGSL